MGKFAMKISFHIKNHTMYFSWGSTHLLNGVLMYSNWQRMPYVSKYLTIDELYMKPVS